MPDTSQFHTPENAARIAAAAKRASVYRLTEDMRIEDATGHVLPLVEILALLNRGAAMGVERDV